MNEKMNEEDLGLDDVESFQAEFTPHHNKIKLNRLVKTALDAAIADSKDSTVKKGLERMSRPSPPVVSIRSNKENGSAPDEKSRVFEPVVQRDAAEGKIVPAEEAKRPSREVDDLPKRFSRDRSKESSRERDHRSRKYRSRSRSRDRDRRRRARSPRRHRSRSKSPHRNNLSHRRYPDPRDQLPTNNSSNNMPPSNIQWPGVPPPAPAWVPNIVNVPYTETPEEKARKLAVEKEAMHQKMTFINQKTEYQKRRTLLLEELELLKKQRRELQHNSTPDVQKILTENAKLKNEIMSKLKSVENVLDMLKGLIGEEHKSPERQFERKKRRSRTRSVSSSVSECSNEKQESHESFSVKGNRSLEPKFNYAYYDPEVHWCRPCKEFPATAKEYLLHLHSADHRAKIQKQDLLELPWHEDNTHSDPVVFEGLPTKRTPIKGLQFLVATSAWYCKLCHSWMGDLHCASLHLKSPLHANSFTEFIEKNPEWETTWLSDRYKAVIASGKQEDILKRQQEEQLLLQKKHEDELRNAIGSSGLIIPLALPTKQPPKRRKTKKDRKKKKRRKSESTSSSSSSSSESSSSSSSDSSTNAKRSRKTDSKKTAPKPRFKAETPEEPRIELRQKEMFKSIPNVPEKHIITMPESPKKPTPQLPGFQFGTRYKRQEFEIKCKKEPVKKPPAALPKSMLGFIGRMPFVKKMKDASDEGKKDVTEPTPPPPPVISSPTKTDADKTKAAKERVFKLQKALSQQQISWPVDMDIDLETDMPEMINEMPSLPPPPPMIGQQFPQGMPYHSGNYLPQDFEEALSIIYPVNQHRTARIVQEEEPPEPPPPPPMSDPTPNEMALLGIDLDDMAVKRFM